MFTFIDLFAGIGGFRIALEENGGKCIFSSEIDKFSRETYWHNFACRIEGDIGLVDAKEVPDHDILVGGFPCQPFSLAGVSKKNSIGADHGFYDETKGTLFFEVARIIKEKRPKAFLLENVKNLKYHDKRRTFKVITNVLNYLGYNVSYRILNGKGFVPQNRERILIVGLDKVYFGGKVLFDFDQVEISTIVPCVRDILDIKIPDKYTLSDGLWTCLQNHANKHKLKGNGFGFGLVDLEGTTRTLSARYYKDGSEILIPQEGKNPRRLTPNECRKLMGFPDWFEIVVSDTQAYKQFGNSVVVPLMQEVVRVMVNTMGL